MVGEHGETRFGYGERAISGNGPAERHEHVTVPFAEEGDVVGVGVTGRSEHEFSVPCGLKRHLLDPRALFPGRSEASGEGPAWEGEPDGDLLGDTYVGGSTGGAPSTQALP